VNDVNNETNPPEPTSSTLSPLVDWMSRHGWKILAALVAMQLLFHAYAVGVRPFPASAVTAPKRVQSDVAPISQ
jgi:hypothetical protein